MDLKTILKEESSEPEKVVPEKKEEHIRKHKKPLQLRDIESRSANKRTDNIESDESISKMLDVEKGVSLKKPWNKLDTGLKLNRLKVFIENEKDVRGLSSSQERELKTLLMGLCQRGKLNKNTEVVYDTSESLIVSIKNLKFNDETEKYNYKEPEVRAKKQSGNKSRSNVDRFLNNR
tara:strand:+ start:2679 stop:3209 length:531 start_codon:yes stop_codon:yes gene_type:complete